MECKTSEIGPKIGGREMRTITPVAKLSLAGIVGMLGWFATPTAALAHDNDHGRGRDHGHHYQGRHGDWHEGRGWHDGRPAFEVRVGGYPRPVVVRPRPIWIPGYWDWPAHQRVWIEGAWGEPPQENMVWVPPQQVWEPRLRQWVWTQGHWAPSA
jgi:hypothetical protein